MYEREKNKCEAYTIRVRCMRIMRISNCNCLQTEFVVDLKCKFDFDASVICFRTCSLSRTCSCFCSNIRTHGKVMMIESIGARLEYINSIYVTQKQIAFSLPCYCRNWMSTDNIEVHSHGTKHDVFNWNSTHEFKGQTNNQNTKIVLMPKSSDPFELNLLIISLVGIHNKFVSDRKLWSVFNQLKQPFNGIVFRYMYNTRSNVTIYAINYTRNIIEWAFNLLANLDSIERFLVFLPDLINIFFYFLR